MRQFNQLFPRSSQTMIRPPVSQSLLIRAVIRLVDNSRAITGFRIQCNSISESNVNSLRTLSFRLTTYEYAVSGFRSCWSTMSDVAMPSSSTKLLLVQALATGSALRQQMSTHRQFKTSSMPELPLDFQPRSLRSRWQTTRSGPVCRIWYAHG